MGDLLRNVAKHKQSIIKARKRKIIETGIVYESSSIIDRDLRAQPMASRKLSSFISYTLLQIILSLITISMPVNLHSVVYDFAYKIIRGISCQWNLRTMW